MKLLSATASIVYLPFLLAGCTDDNRSDSKYEQFLRKLENINHTIAGIGFYPEQPVHAIEKKLLSKKEAEAVYRYDEESDRNDFFTPVTEQYKYAAFETVAELPSTRSIDVLWPGSLIQGKSVIDGNLSAIPVADKRAPANIVLNIVSG